MNKVPTTSGGCGCCGDSIGGVSPTPGGGGNGGSFPRVIVRSAPNLLIGNVINPYMENGNQIYELDDLILQKPVLVFGNDAPLIEVGETIPIVTFSGQITQGTYPIVARSLTPDPGGLDLTAPFSFEVLNVKLSAPGTTAQYTLSATDDHGNNSSKMSSVSVKHAFYQGFNTAQTLNDVQIKALVNKTLNDNIIQQYGGTKSYTVPNSPAVPAYIYWWYPVGTQAIAAALLNGLGLPLVDVGPVDVANPYDNTIVTPYVGKRTANLINPGTYLINLS